jgi:hypothetical protein
VENTEKDKAAWLAGRFTLLRMMDMIGATDRLRWSACNLQQIHSNSTMESNPSLSLDLG